MARFVASLLLLIVTSRVDAGRRVYSQRYLEEQAKGTEIFHLKNHVTPSMRGKVTFRLLNQVMRSGNDEINPGVRWVNLNSKTGVVSVRRPVDREKDCGETEPCVISVSIAQLPQSNIQLITLKLDITDVNDHYPVFPIDPIVVNVSEKAPVGTRISLNQYLATDKDSGEFARITYSLSRNTFFGLDSRKDETEAPRLDLVVADDLDHERSSEEELVLTALDGGQPIKSTRATLIVRIVDANDNPPVFTKPVITISLRESLAVNDIITTVEARDADSGDFGTVRYFIPVGGNTATARKLIRIDPISGRVYLNQSLDYAKHHDIRIAIGARDLGGSKSKEGKTILEIKVIDVNDNSPVIRIDPIVYSEGGKAYLSESVSTGFYVAEVVVTDADKGKNGQVVTEISTYPLMPALGSSRSHVGAALSGYFVLTEDGLIKTDRDLDRENIPAFLIDVKSCDSATPQRCSSKNFTIELLDENDNYPVFDDVKPRQLKEDTSIGTRVATVTATDRDLRFEPSYRLTKDERLIPATNGVITYRLEGGKGVFVIDRTTGDIRLAGNLDFESRPQWKLTVVASDEGSPPKSTSNDVIVDVINVNDNKPVFVYPAIMNATILATIKSEDVIANLKAEDADNDQLRYSIVLEDGKKPINGAKFIVDSRTGALRLNFSNPNIKKMIGEHSLTVKVQDQGIPPSEGATKIIVRVTDLSMSEIERQKILNEREDFASGDVTVVLIASLAAATVLLVIVLTAVVVKCKRENKEIRTYNCRSAETKKGWQLGASQATLTNEMMAAASKKQMMSSRESNLNGAVWSATPARRLSYETKDQLLKCSVSRSTSQIYQGTTDRQMTSFSKPTRSESAHPLTSQIDGDSGRGDSDHDTGSCEDKERLAAESALPTVSSYPVDPCDVQMMEINDNNDMGPLCTSSCREMGHSDRCWMNVYDSRAEDYVDPRRCNTPSYAYQQIINSSPMTPCGLETICETQPLHSVLSNEDEPEESYLAESSYLNRSQSALGGYYPQDSMYGSSYTMPYQRNSEVPLPHSSNYETIYMSEQGYPERPPSASELFHDGHTQQQQQQYYPTYSSPSKPVQRSSSPSAKSDSGASGKRRSTASLHGELLHRRFLAVAQGNASRADDAQTRSMTPSQYGHVSMQETQQIIDDIEQLIDHA